MATFGTSMTEDFGGIRHPFTGVLGTYLILMAEEGCKLTKISQSGHSRGSAWNFYFDRDRVKGTIHTTVGITESSERYVLGVRFLPYSLEAELKLDFRSLDELRTGIREILAQAPTV